MDPNNSLPETGQANAPLSPSDRPPSRSPGVSWSVAAVVVLAGIVATVLLLEEHPNAAAQPKLTWSTSSQQLTLSRGDTATQTLTLTSDTTINNAQLEAVPAIAPFLTIQPSSFATLAANDPQTIRISFMIPQSAAFGTYAGTIHVRHRSQTLPQTLKVTLNVWQALSSNTVGFSVDYPQTWNASVLGNEADLSNVSLSTASFDERFVGICKIHLATLSKNSDQSLGEWFAATSSLNGDPPPISLTPILVQGTSGLKVMSGETGLVETVYLALSPTTLASVVMICGEDVRATLGEPVLNELITTVKPF